MGGPALSKLGIPTGERSNNLFHVVDWLPTIADMIGVVPRGKTLDGVSHLPAFRNESGREAPPRQEVFVGYAADSNHWYGPAIRFKNWKLVQGTSGGPDERDPEPSGSATPAPGGVSNTTYLLFNLKSDKTEMENLAEAHPNIVALLRYKLQEYQKGYVPPQITDPSCPFVGLGNTSLGPTWYVWFSRKGRFCSSLSMETN